jgi:hypothetical protein
LLENIEVFQIENKKIKKGYLLLACHAAASHIPASHIPASHIPASHILGHHRCGYSNWADNCSCDAKGSNNCDCHQEKFCIHWLNI